MYICYLYNFFCYITEDLSKSDIDIEEIMLKQELFPDIGHFCNESQILWSKKKFLKLVKSHFNCVCILVLLVWSKFLIYYPSIPAVVMLRRLRWVSIAFVITKIYSWAPVPRLPGAFAKLECWPY